MNETVHDHGYAYDFQSHCTPTEQCHRSKCRKPRSQTDTSILQIKYFKEKRVMEYNRDRVIEKIKQDDAAAQGRQSGKTGGGRGLFG